MAIAELDPTTIKARPGSRLTNAQAQAIAPELAALEEAKALKPDAVVERARDPGNPLHALFEWDDAVAGHQHRLATARMIIRSITYRVQSIGPNVADYTAAFVSVEESDDNEETGEPHAPERRYADVRRVLSDDRLCEQVKASIARDLQSLIRRMETLKALENALGKARELLEAIKAA